MTNHLEALTTEWLDYNGYFVRTAVRVGKRANGGWDGELDVVGFHPGRRHLLHVECSVDAWTWPVRESKFARKFAMGREHARTLFSEMQLPAILDQVVVHGYAAAADQHRGLAGGRLMTSQELVAEVIIGVPPSSWKNAVPEMYPLLRTLQIAKMAGASAATPRVSLIPVRYDDGQNQRPFRNIRGAPDGKLTAITKFEARIKRAAPYERQVVSSLGPAFA